MKKIVLFGLGGRYGWARRMNDGRARIVALSDNNPSLHGQVLDGYPVVPPSDLPRMDFDRILVTSTFFTEIRRGLMRLGIPGEKILRMEVVSDLVHAKLPQPWWERSFQDYLDHLDGLGPERFSIVSNNCWGGLLYQSLGLPYATPFVGLFVQLEQFAHLLDDLPGYLAEPLRFASTEKAGYPVGLLGNVELHFTHYKDEAEARSKWERRLERFDHSNLLVKMSLRHPEQLRLARAVPQNRAIIMSLFPCELGDERFLCLPELCDSPEWGRDLNEYTVSRRHADLIAWLNGHPVSVCRARACAKDRQTP